MLGYYLKTTYRSFIRHKGYSSINIAGLALGMACCILIMLWVVDELSYDRYHEHGGNLYRVVEEWQDGDWHNRGASVTTLLAPAMKEKCPEIVGATRVHIGGEQLIKYGDRSFENDVIALADPEFMDMFSFPVVKGDCKTILSDRFSVVVTESMSRKYFGDEEPLGKTLNIDSRDFQVTGVIADLPHNSHLQFDCLTPFISRPDWMIEVTDNWNVSAFYAYVQLRPDAVVSEVCRKGTELLAEHQESIDSKAAVGLQPITRIHLHHDVKDYLEGHGEITYVYIFTGLALLTLLIACINFMNLSTARAGRRAHEVGLRKAVGAHRTDLVRQFLGESVFLSFVALLFSLALVEMLIPALNTWSGKQLSMFSAGSIQIALILVCIVLLTGVAAGSYPALLLSSFKPVSVLKGHLTSGRTSRLFRQLLVVSQFVMSIALIIGAVVMYMQLEFIRNKGLGFDRERMVYFTKRGGFAADYKTIKSELTEHPAIAAVTSGTPPVRMFGGAGSPEWEGKQGGSEISWSSLAVENDYIETLGMEIVQGRGFLEELAPDVSQGFVINETAARIMGSESPIGKRFSFNRTNFNWNTNQFDEVEYESTIIGVVRDFHYGSLHSSIEPVVIFLDAEQANRVCVRISDGHTAEAVLLLKQYWSRYVPDHLFEFQFVDEVIDSFYRFEQRLSVILYSFTSLAILISCLGLFGLASFSAEQRTREIGIRRVLGASAASVVRLLSREFLALVAIANLVAWPVAYYAMNGWLENFAYRIDIRWSTLLLAGVLALVIALLTVSYQAVKAACANPVEALKYE